MQTKYQNNVTHQWICIVCVKAHVSLDTEFEEITEHRELDRNCMLEGGVKDDEG